ncbi:hypothetical protein NQ318_007571 [Aromia moschata]|uniref:Tc1-like transposase DDE domain-containing protein n=1 Tax=Aromia moschata TaxID=1265417 RepID=A0AAV8YAT6_9CUCU|nr:hypothetical protein NQ318_007571 [Aromia moschata]
MTKTSKQQEYRRWQTCIQLKETHNFQVMRYGSSRMVHQNITNSQIIFTDEACFTRKGITNLHNYHEYSDVNPHPLSRSFVAFAGPCFVTPHAKHLGARAEASNINND